MQILVHTYMNKHPGVSVDQAITRLAVQEELGQAFAELRGEFSDRLSAISLQHEPDQHILVELAGQDPVPDRTVRTRSGATRVTFETGNAHTSKEFYDILDRNKALIYSLIPGVTGISGYPGDNRLVILIEGDAALADSMRTNVRKLERVTGFNIDVEPNNPKSTNMEYVVGGAVLQNNNSYCTSGFPVKHTATGRRGITTAGHCPNELIYGNYATGDGKYTVPLTYVAGLEDASHDVQWHTVGSNTPLNEVYGTSISDSGRRAITSMWNNAEIGQEMCFRGVRSGYSCGTVVDNKHSPGIACGPGENIPCANAWIRITGDQLACAPGDSGAAIFQGNSGYGIVTKGNSTTPMPGDCKGVTAMPWGAISALGLSSS
ncbi:hypothetical protein ABFU84_00790 [Xanthomonas translucens pv. undulosa]|uniref:hypothetical protein n=1 Tax=Xanthomonas campestris pv. translucens TaxID=343 RepID=UPI003CF8DE11